MIKTKNILSHILFIVLLLPVAMPLFLQVKISLLKLDAEERLEENTMITIHIPVNKVYWEKKGKEILINNQLFDVKEYSQTKTEIIATGWYDDPETKLEKQVDEIWQVQTNKQTICLVNYFQLLGNAFFQQNNFDLPPTYILQKTFPREVACRQKDRVIKIPLPPPQLT